MLIADARFVLRACVLGANGRTTRLVYEALDGDVAAHAKRTAELLGECFVSQDHREGVAAFLERRDPSFTGR